MTDTPHIISYSQLGEDIFAFQNFMNVPRADAVLIEVGAYDGRTYSNTLALEDYSKCKCILIEPSPVNVRKLYANRPTASIHKVAVMQEFGVREFLGHSPVSGAADELTEKYVATWKLDKLEPYGVMSAPMKAITAMENLEYIDFMSIDVQGAEFHVLSSMDWNIPVGVICIELEGQRPQFDEACRGILRGMGFEFRKRLHISEFWILPSYERHHLIFDPSLHFPLSAFNCRHFNEKWKEALNQNFYDT